MTIKSTIQTGEGEPLVFAAGMDAIKNIVLDASLVPANSKGIKSLIAGTLLTKSAGVSPTGKDQLIRYQGTGLIAGVLAKDVVFADGTSDADVAAGMFYHGCVFNAAKIVDYSLYGNSAISTLNTCKFETQI